MPGDAQEDSSLELSFLIAFIKIQQEIEKQLKMQETIHFSGQHTVKIVNIELNSILEIPRFNIIDLWLTYNISLEAK